MPRFTFPIMAQRKVGDKLNVASKRFEWDGVKWKPVVTSGIPVEAPSINLIDTGSDYITVNFTNNDEDPVRFLYEIDDDTPDANILELNSGQTSSNITFSNLSQDTSYTIFLTPVIEGRVVESINLEESTLRITQAPTISNTSRTHTSISFRINNPHNYEVTTYYEIGDSSPDANQVTISSNSFEDVTLSGLSSNTSYTVYAFSIETGQVASNTISQSISTLTYTTATPTITITNVSADSVSFNLKNNDGSTVTMYYEVNDSTPDSTVTVSSGQTISRTVSGLSDGTGYTLYARAKASNENMSSTTSSGFTTPVIPVSVYLLTNGQANTSVSGAWYFKNGGHQTVNPAERYSTSSGTDTWGSWAVEFRSNSLWAESRASHYYGYGGSISHDNLVDISGKTKLYIDNRMGHNDCYNRGYVTVRVNDENIYSEVINCGDVSRRTIEVDLPGSGMMQLFFGTSTVWSYGIGYNEVYNVWME